MLGSGQLSFDEMRLALLCCASVCCGELGYVVVGLDDAPVSWALVGSVRVGSGEMRLGWLSSGRVSLGVIWYGLVRPVSSRLGSPWSAQSRRAKVRCGAHSYGVFR